MNLEAEEKITYDKKNEELVIRRKIAKIKAPFSAVGELTLDGEKQTDIFDLLDQVSKGAFSVFTVLKRRRNVNNNLATYSTKDWSKTHRETFSRRLRELRRKGIVRVARAKMVGQDLMRPYICKRQTYMINPDLLKCWDYDDANLLWNQCKP